MHLLDFHTKEGDEANVAFGGLRGRGVKKQDPPIERDLHLALEDLFYGCTKKIKISRRVSHKAFLSASVLHVLGLYMFLHVWPFINAVHCHCPPS